MSPALDDNIDRQLGILIERTEQLRTEIVSLHAKLDSNTANYEQKLLNVNTRIAQLELRWAERYGSTKMAGAMLAGAATLGALASTLLGHLIKYFQGG